ncbi:hypothetical protein PoB_002568700 [Plakobranchus ocellatus]|uniref:Uncharacterized protein n=1 Tax=Plakobranchus ocellatus TaxID=259542 RepID=A0AAV3ZVT0_9GAST|nr:hypothetical protein PoB_002568700 [Plakobranchus ocellatus]
MSSSCVCGDAPVRRHVCCNVINQSGSANHKLRSLAADKVAGCVYNSINGQVGCALSPDDKDPGNGLAWRRSVAADNGQRPNVNARSRHWKTFSVTTLVSVT